MNRCSRCVLPETRPDTAFVDGVCSACLAYEKRKEVDWDSRKSDLLKLLDEHDGRCIVPSSGGKDSTYQVLTLLEFGARPTVVTATTCMLSDIGRRNIDNLARFAPTIEVTPNRTVRAKLNKIGLEMVGDISWPEHSTIFSVPFRMAVSLNNPLIFFGENPQREYGGPIGTQDAREMTLRWRSEFGGFLGLRPSDIVGIDGLTLEDMNAYEAPSAMELARVGVQAHFLGQYLPWDSHRNADLAEENGMIQRIPFIGNFWRGENLDNIQTGVHDFFGFLKYGFGRAAVQLSVDIRSGVVSRDYAMQKVRAIDGLFPLVYMGVRLEEVLERIKMTRAEFLICCARFLNQDLFTGPVEWSRRPLLKEFA